tara:strand:- start:346 stop:951 length:606 start_codon:yes stop_codon:yes gene_type:complete
MRSIYNFIIEPFNDRYENEKVMDGNVIIVNTNIEDHKFISKKAKVIAVPLAYKTTIKPGDEIYVHHNVFRRYYGMDGKEKNGSTYFKDKLYFCGLDQIYLHKVNDKLQTNLEYCFVKPIHNKSFFSVEKEEPLLGILKYTNPTLIKQGLLKDSLITFTPNSEFEFIINGERLYCMKSNNIALKHEYEGNEKEYNPSWTNCS